MVNFSRRWNGDNGDNGMAIVFEKFYHHHQWFLVGSTIGYDGFSMVFPILRTNGSQWLQTEICDKLRVNKDVKKLAVKDSCHPGFPQTPGSFRANVTRLDRVR